ncbi:ammonia-dependent NAD(+) synthetase [Metabacillus malikii]|uniref:NH(3)-dependent NAD(+) synthetase n=1 Tax=Metabacillus malikii TaxID=1504265 RepID=A0ABT9ZKU8_9BACI|nr:ammonia-dependent NAD(+) synthetase [Metabacillus malikii]MDQ0232519.1 NAD+ synthase [Metabacillus malikii]
MRLQKQIMTDLQVNSTIHPQEEIKKRIAFLKDYVKRTKAKGLVLGISGGQDSSLAGRLAQLAVEDLRNEGYEAKFIAVRLPYNIQKDEDDAQLALSFIKPDESIAFDIANTVDIFAKSYLETTGEQLSDFNKGNVKARVRMITQYAIGGQNGLLVIGTDHAAEAVTGFYTKYGDGGADLLPLAGLTKRQGKSLLIELNAPERLYLKTPTADLLDNTPLQADETELGISYDQLDDYLEGKNVPQEIAEKIENRYLMSQHKRELPATMHDNWWK